MDTKVLRPRVDVDFPEETWRIVEQTNVAFRGALFDQLIELRGDEARRLPKVNEARLDLAERGEQLMRANPRFVPPFVNPDTMRRNIEAARRLRIVERWLAEQLDRVRDTKLVLQVQSDADLRAFYLLLQRAAEMGEPAASRAYEELSPAYARKRKPAGRSQVDGESPPDDDEDDAAVEAGAFKD